MWNMTQGSFGWLVQWLRGQSEACWPYILECRIRIPTRYLISAGARMVLEMERGRETSWNHIKLVDKVPRAEPDNKYQVNCDTLRLFRLSHAIGERN